MLESCNPGLWTAGSRGTAYKAELNRTLRICPRSQGVAAPSQLHPSFGLLANQETKFLELAPCLPLPSPNIRGERRSEL